MKKPSRKSLVKKLDAAISVFIRTRDAPAQGGKCFYECGNRIECACHVIAKSRGGERSRFDPEDIVAGCSSCNVDERHHPSKYAAIFIRKRGAEKYLELEDRAAVRPLLKHSPKELQALISHYADKLKELDTES